MLRVHAWVEHLPVFFIEKSDWWIQHHKRQKFIVFLILRSLILVAATVTEGWLHHNAVGVDLAVILTCSSGMPVNRRQVRREISLAAGGFVRR